MVNKAANVVGSKAYTSALGEIANGQIPQWSEKATTILRDAARRGDKKAYMALESALKRTQQAGVVPQDAVSKQMYEAWVQGEKMPTAWTDNLHGVSKKWNDIKASVGLRHPGADGETLELPLPSSQR